MKIAVKILSLILAAALMLGTIAMAVEVSSPGESTTPPAGNGLTVTPRAANTTNYKVTVAASTNGSISVTYTGADGNAVVLTSASASGGVDVPADTVLKVTATPSAGYALKELKQGENAIANDSSITLSAAVSFSATFEEKQTGGDTAIVNSYELEAICSGSSNWNYYHKDTSANKKYAKYIATGGGSTNSSEIVNGDYVDLTLYITDSTFEKFASGTDLSTVSVSTTGASVLRTTGYTTAANGLSVSKREGGYAVKLPGLVYGGASGDLVVLVSFGSYNAILTTAIKNTTPTPVPDKEEKPVTTDAAKPYVIISSYSYGKGDLVAGETRNVTMTFTNTSEYLSVENMMVTMSLPADAMVLTSSSNTFYVKSLEAGKSITKTVNVTVKPTAPVQSQAMTVNFTYDYLDSGTRKSASTDESISMPIVQVDRFTVTGIEMQDTLFTSEESSLSVNFVNKGRSDVYNISAKISCAGIANDGEEQYIGNLASGTTSSADFYITAQEAGALSGEVIITYEDTNMQERTVSIPFSGTVMSYEDVYGPMDPGMEDPGMMEPEQPQQQGFPWYWIVLGVFVVGGGVFFYLKKRKSNKENVDEDEDF